MNTVGKDTPMVGTAGTTSAPRRVDVWLALSIGYLFLPNFIFLFGWVRPVIGIPAAIAVGWSFLNVAFAKRPELPGRQTPGLLTVAFVVVAALVWVALSGIGGIAPQSWDFREHNYLYHDLVRQSWPVVYEIKGGGQAFLCYCVAYYLPTALAVRLLGDAWLGPLSFVWSALGAGLFFYWISTRHKASKRFLIFVIFYAVTGPLWYLVKMHLPLLKDPPLVGRLSDGGLLHACLDLATKFYYTPQHSIAATLVTALLYELLWVRREPRGAGLVWAGVLLWSPLTSIGLLVIPFVSLWRVRFSDWFSLPNLLGGGVLVVMMGVFYKSHEKLEFSAPIWSFPAASPWPLLYALFVVFQFAAIPLLFFIDKKYKVLGEHRPMLLGATVMLAILPLYRLGFESDLRMQASTPSLIIVGIAVALCFLSESFSPRRPLFSALLVVYLIGALYPVTRPLRNLFVNQEKIEKESDFEYTPRRLILNLLTEPNRQSYENQNRATGLEHLPELNKTWNYNFAAQYLGRIDSPAWKYMLRNDALTNAVQNLQ